MKDSAVKLAIINISGLTLKIKLADKHLLTSVPHTYNLLAQAAKVD